MQQQYIAITIRILALVQGTDLHNSFLKSESGSLLPIIQDIIVGSLDKDCNKIKGCGTCYKPSLKLGTILKQLHSRFSSESSQPDPASCSSSSGRLGCANKHNEVHKYAFKLDLVCRPF